MVSYRDTEHTHAAVFAELLREPVTREVHLGGLSAVWRAKLASIVGSDVADAMQDASISSPVVTRSSSRRWDGSSQTAGLALSSPAVPASVLDAIAGRLARLTPASVTLLRAGSIIGRDFSTAVVAAMLTLPVLECLAPLDEACAAGLVEPGASPGEHRFAHALIRDAIDAGLSTPERVRLHRWLPMRSRSSTPLTFLRTCSIWPGIGRSPPFRVIGCVRRVDSNARVRRRCAGSATRRAPACFVWRSTSAAASSTRFPGAGCCSRRPWRCSDRVKSSRVSTRAWRRRPGPRGSVGPT